MTLREWLNKTLISVSSFSALLKVDRSYIHSWLRGDKKPSKWIMARIKQVTLGKVTILKDKDHGKNNEEKD